MKGRRRETGKGVSNSPITPRISIYPKEKAAPFSGRLSAFGIIPSVAAYREPLLTSVSF